MKNIYVLHTNMFVQCVYFKCNTPNIHLRFKVFNYSYLNGPVAYKYILFTFLFGSRTLVTFERKKNVESEVIFLQIILNIDSRQSIVRLNRFFNFYIYILKYQRQNILPHVNAKFCEVYTSGTRSILFYTLEKKNHHPPPK